MENKLVHMALFYLESGEKPRYKVTNKLKNYPTEMRDDAVSYLVSEKLIYMREERNSGLRGRTPVFIGLTEKGLERCLEVSRKPRHKSVWNI